MPHTKAKITICCGRCRSSDVRRDAYAEWNAETQDWVLCDVYDHGFCNACEGDAILVERHFDTGLPVLDYDRFADEDTAGWTYSPACGFERAA